MKKENYKVPIAVLSCFLIAFILQGALKLGGVFVFEKVLDWGIFKIIDNTLWLQILYYSLIMFVTTYCLSFAMTDKFYSKKWYHYVILVLCSFGVTSLRLLVPMSYQIHLILDVFIYILVPFVVWLTTNSAEKLLKNDLLGILITITIQILLYFAYLGLCYWSNVLTSLLPIDPVWLPASTNFLIRLEVYFGMVLLVITLNTLIKKLKGVFMNLPIDIASKRAKLLAKKDKLLKEVAKIDSDLAKLPDEE